MHAMHAFALEGKFEAAPEVEGIIVKTTSR